MYKRVVDELATDSFDDYDDYVISFLDGKPPIVIKNVWVGSSCNGSGYHDRSPKIEYASNGHVYLNFVVVKLSQIDKNPKAFHQIHISRFVKRKICVDGLMSVDRLPDYWEFVADEDYYEEDYSYEKHSGYDRIPTEEELDNKQPFANNFLLLEDNANNYVYDTETYKKCFGEYEED